jgi:hypothetical protein
MRPPLLTDEMILCAIRDLAPRGRVTGTAVRALLAERYGARGGVARVYRLLTEASRPAAGAREPGPVLPQASGTLAAALERAALAEEREMAHQNRWLRETEALKERLQAAEQGARETTELRLRVAQLRHALAGAQARIAELEGRPIAPKA